MPNIQNQIRYTVLNPFAGKEEVEPTGKGRLTAMARDTIIGVGLGMLARHGIQTMLKKKPFEMAQALSKLKSQYKQVGTKFELPQESLSLIERMKFGLVEGAKNKKPFTPKMIAADAALAGAIGYYTPDIRNILIRARKDKEELKKLDGPFSKFHAMSKTGSWYGGIGKGIAGTGKAIGYGYLPVMGRLGKKIAGKPNFTIPEKAWSAAVLGGTAVGGYTGGKALYNYARRQRDTRAGEYTTLLRNNILAGRVNPQELSTADMTSVRELGMR